MTVDRGGSSSTLPRDTSVIPSVVEAGVDTWRLTFGTALELGAGVFDLGDHRAQWMPGVGQLAVEGHPHAADALCPAGQLPDAYALVVDQLGGVGHAATRFLGVSRLDSTATLRFDDARRGELVLAGLAALDWPGSEATVRPAMRPRSVSVTSLRGRRHQLRAYDKGTERGDVAAGLAQPFELVRLEAQWRFRSDHRLKLSELSAAAVRERFERRFLPLYRATKGLTVGSLPFITDAIADQLAAGELTYREAERLAGFLCIAASRCDGHYPLRARQRRRAELRERGLVVAEHVTEPLHVELSDVLEAALESPLWGAQG